MGVRLFCFYVERVLGIQLTVEAPSAFPMKHRRQQFENLAVLALAQYGSCKLAHSAKAHWASDTVPFQQ